MSVTLPELRSWAPTTLESTAADVDAARRQMDESAADLRTAARMLDEGWQGDAATGAVGAVRTQERAGSGLVETLSLVRRALLRASDAIAASQALLVQAEALAAANGLVLTATGVRSLGPEATTSQRRARADVQEMVRFARDSATEADRDAARAVRAALDAAQLTSSEERELVDDIGLHEVPAGRDPRDVALWWASLSPAAQALLIRTEPMLIGNLDGVPFEARIAANEINVRTTLRESGQEIRDLESRIAEIEAQVRAAGEGVSAGSRGYPAPHLLSSLASMRERLVYLEQLREFCRELTSGATTTFDAEGRIVPRSGHQVLVFDPDGGRFAEVVGSIGPTTKDIAVLVGGTGTNLFTMSGDNSQYTRAESFVSSQRVQPPGSLALISYLGGPMPQVVAFDAFDPSYARDQGDALASFVNGIDRQGGVPITVVGHSYGGLVVGAGEVAGMRADRVLHVESAGAGPSVRSVEQYANPETPRYSMTAPGDPIMYAQGAGFGLVHGADPDLLGGVTRLETGVTDHDDRSSALLSGGAAHSGVFNENSTAWRNMLAVMTGGEAMVYTEPAWVDPDPDRLHVEEYRYPFTDPTFVPPTKDVP